MKKSFRRDTIHCVSISLPPRLCLHSRRQNVNNMNFSSLYILSLYLMPSYPFLTLPSLLRDRLKSNFNPALAKTIANFLRALSAQRREGGPAQRRPGEFPPRYIPTNAPPQPHIPLISINLITRPLTPNKISLSSLVCK